MEPDELLILDSAMVYFLICGAVGALMSVGHFCLSRRAFTWRTILGMTLLGVAESWIVVGGCFGEQLPKWRFLAIALSAGFGIVQPQAVYLLAFLLKRLGFPEDWINEALGLKKPVTTAVREGDPCPKSE